ncbi:hypothetical protein ACFLS0_03600 [Candidatus Bipolaricaulota bacterium]
MPALKSLPKYERPLTPPERLFTRSPFSIVAMLVRIKGAVTEAMLRNAGEKVQQRHSNLRQGLDEFTH